MKAYAVSCDGDWPHAHEVIAHSKWSLPAVKCAECGSRAWSLGVRYPSLQLPEGLAAEPYLHGRAVKLKVLSELRAQLLNAWKQDVPLPPGAGFGPLVGKGSGKCGDVAWAPFAVLLSADAAQRLRRCGVTSLKLVPTEIKWRSRKAPDYLELDIPATARFSPLYLARLRLYDGAARCSTCGFMRRRLTELPDRKARLEYQELSYYRVLHAPSLPLGWDLLRIQDAETTVIASEHFREAALEAGLTNISFRELAVQGLLLPS